MAKLERLTEGDDPVVKEYAEELRERIRMLEEKYINPKIPYEAADLEEISVDGE